MIRRLASPPALALLSTLLWGAIELLALQRVRHRPARSAAPDSTC